MNFKFKTKTRCSLPQQHCQNQNCETKTRTTDFETKTLVSRPYPCNYHPLLRVMESDGHARQKFVWVGCNKLNRELYKQPNCWFCSQNPLEKDALLCVVIKNLCVRYLCTCRTKFDKKLTRSNLLYFYTNTHRCMSTAYFRNLNIVLHFRR